MRIVIEDLDGNVINSFDNRSNNLHVDYCRSGSFANARFIFNRPWDGTYFVENLVDELSQYPNFYISMLDKDGIQIKKEKVSFADYRIVSKYWISDVQNVELAQYTILT